MKPTERTADQIREHYEIEKRLADRLRNSTRAERRTLYATVYDELFRSVPHHSQLTRKSSPEESTRKAISELKRFQSFLSREATFLEVGPGDCALSFEAAKHVKTVYAIDVSEEITRSSSCPQNFKLILSDGTSIPVPENSVDVAYSNQLMEHLHSDDALEQLHNIFNALKRGGVYICITPNRISGPHDISKYFDTVATGFHLKEYSVSELDNLFKKTGFSKVRVFLSIKKFRIFLPLFLIKLIERVLDMLRPETRKTISSSKLISKVLGINMIGIK